MKKKPPKLSYAVLKGIEKYPNKATGIFITFEGDEACVIGGALGAYKLRTWQISKEWNIALDRFEEEYGISIYDANDGYHNDKESEGGMDREWIYGMLVAINE